MDLMGKRKAMGFLKINNINMALQDFRAIYLPYCLIKQSNGGYVVLNREYKPLGFNTSDRVEYEDYPITTKFKSLTKKVASELSWSKSESLDEIFLYNDATNPLKSKRDMDVYLKRIERLAKLKRK